MLSFLSWIPILGPILQGLFTTASSIYLKYKDTQLGMRRAEVQEAVVSADIIKTTNDDIALRFMRDLLCFPTVVWACLIGWDTILADHRQTLIPHEWMFHVANYPASVGYLPYAVVVFLLGNIGINTWSRNK